MASMEEKMGALTKLMQEGVLTADEFARVVSVLSGSSTTPAPLKEKTPLEKQYDEVFSKYISNAFKSPASCKWPELQTSMIKRGPIKYYSANNIFTRTYIETYIDSANSYGALLRKPLRLVLDDNGIIVRALEEMQTNSVTLLGTIANAMSADVWCDIVTLPTNPQYNTNSGPSASQISGYWICKKCEEKNPANARYCRGCGVFK